MAVMINRADIINHIKDCTVCFFQDVKFSDHTTGALIAEVISQHAEKNQ